MKRLLLASAIGAVALVAPVSAAGPGGILHTCEGKIDFACNETPCVPDYPCTVTPCAVWYSGRCISN